MTRHDYLPVSSTGSHEAYCTGHFIAGAAGTLIAIEVTPDMTIASLVESLRREGLKVAGPRDIQIVIAGVEQGDSLPDFVRGHLKG